MLMGNIKITKRVFTTNKEKANLTIRLSVDMIDALEKISTEYGYSKSELVATILDQWLQHELGDRLKKNTRSPKNND